MYGEVANNVNENITRSIIERTLNTKLIDRAGYYVPDGYVAGIQIQGRMFFLEGKGYDSESDVDLEDFTYDMEEYKLDNFYTEFYNKLSPKLIDGFKEVDVNIQCVLSPKFIKISNGVHNTIIYLSEMDRTFNTLPIFVGSTYTHESVNIWDKAFDVNSTVAKIVELTEKDFKPIEQLQLDLDGGK